jgi:glycosyltransferase involved in cell wall biosynthesis
MRNVSVVYSASKGYVDYLRLSLRTVPADVHVVVAWSADDSPPAFDHPSVEVVPVKRDKENFCKARAVNAAARAVKTDWLLFADADFLFPKFLFNVLDLSEGGKTVTRFYVARFTKELSDEIMLRGRDWETHFSEYPGGVQPSFVERLAARYLRKWLPTTALSALTAVDYTSVSGTPNPCLYSRELFFAVGGYDESFVGWGGEDDDLSARGRAAGGIDRRLPVIVGHLYHPPAVEYRKYRASSPRPVISRSPA